MVILKIMCTFFEIRIFRIWVVLPCYKEVPCMVLTSPSCLSPFTYTHRAKSIGFGSATYCMSLSWAINIWDFQFLYLLNGETDIYLRGFCGESGDRKSVRGPAPLVENKEEVMVMTGKNWK